MRPGEEGLVAAEGCRESEKGQAVPAMPPLAVVESPIAGQPGTRCVRRPLTGICPTLEQAFDYAAHKGALILLTRHQPPAAAATSDSPPGSPGHGVRHRDAVADTALRAAPGGAPARCRHEGGDTPLWLGRSAPGFKTPPTTWVGAGVVAWSRQLSGYSHTARSHSS
jgi:hypothetical protein